MSLKNDINLFKLLLLLRIIEFSEFKQKMDELISFVEEIPLQLLENFSVKNSKEISFAFLKDTENNLWLKMVAGAFANECFQVYNYETWRRIQFFLLKLFEADLFCSVKEDQVFYSVINDDFNMFQEKLFNNSEQYHYIEEFLVKKKSKKSFKSLSEFIDFDFRKRLLEQ